MQKKPKNPDYETFFNNTDYEKVMQYIELDMFLDIYTQDILRDICFPSSENYWLCMESRIDSIFSKTEYVRVALIRLYNKLILDNPEIQRFMLSVSMTDDVDFPQAITNYILPLLNKYLDFVSLETISFIKEEASHLTELGHKYKSDSRQDFCNLVGIKALTDALQAYYNNREKQGNTNGIIPKGLYFEDFTPILSEGVFNEQYESSFDEVSESLQATFLEIAKKINPDILLALQDDKMTQEIANIQYETFGKCFTCATLLDKSTLLSYYLDYAFIKDYLFATRLIESKLANYKLPLPINRKLKKMEESKYGTIHIGFSDYDIKALPECVNQISLPIKTIISPLLSGMQSSDLKSLAVLLLSETSYYYSTSKTPRIHFANARLFNKDIIQLALAKETYRAYEQSKKLESSPNTESTSD